MDYDPSCGLGQKPAKLQKVIGFTHQGIAGPGLGAVQTDGPKPQRRGRILSSLKLSRLKRTAVVHVLKASTIKVDRPLERLWITGP